MRRAYGAAGLTLLIVCLAAAAWARPAAADAACGTFPLAERFADAPGLSTAFAHAAPPAAVGDKWTFFTHIPETRARATLRLIAERCSVWVDDRFADVATDAAISDLAREFDRVIYPSVRAWFGSEWLPGVDGDSRVTILLHDVEGNGNAAGFGGYFSPVDELARLPNSNAREMLFLDVFALRDYDRFRLINLVAHEFTHLLNWHQRGGRLDERWLEEGRATLAEWAVYGNIHSDFATGYLSKPSLSLTAGNTLQTWYGGSFLLLLYCVDQYGGRSFAQNLGRAPGRGMAAVAGAMQASGNARALADLLRSWTLANLVNDRAAHPSAGYTSLRRDFRVPASAIDRRQSLPARGTARLGAWSAAYVELSNLPETWSVRVTAEAGAPFAATVWRPAAGEAREVRLDPNGTGVHTIRGNAGESATLILAAPVDAALSYEVAPGADRDGDTPSAFPTPVAPNPNRFAPTGSLRMDGASGSLTALDALPIGADLLSVAVAGDTLWAAAGWGIAAFDRTVLGSPRLRAIAPTDGLAQDVLLVGDALVVAQGRSGIGVYARDTLERLATRATTGDASRLAAFGTWLFVLNSDTGLRVFDLTDAANPRLAQTSFGSGGIDLAVGDGRLFMSDASQGLQVFALDGLPALRRIGRGAFRVQGMAPAGDTLWAATDRLVSIDLRDLNALKTVTRGDTVGVPQRIALRGNTLAVAETEGISFWDARDPANARFLSRIPLDGDPMSLVWVGDWVYVAEGDRLAAVNAADPSAPRLTWVSQASGEGRRLSASGGIVAAAIGSGGVAVIGVSVPAGTRPLAYAPTLSPANAARLGTGIAVAATDDGVEAFDLADPSRPRRVSALSLAGPVIDVALSPDGRTVYAGGIGVTALSLDAGTFKVRGGASSSGHVAALALAGTALYAAATESGVDVFDASDPANLRLVRTLPTTGSARALQVDGNRLFVGAGTDIVVYDVAGPLAPVPVARWDAGFDLRVLTAQAGWVFAGGESYVAAWNAKDPAAPIETARVRSLDWVGGIALVGSRLLTADATLLRTYRRTDDGAPLAVEPVEEGSSQGEPPSQVVTRIGQNYPNPFNPETWIPFTLAETSRVDVTVYAADGRVVRTIHAGVLPSGDYSSRVRAIPWDGRNDQGEPVAAGLYWYEVRIAPSRGGAELRSVQRMLLIR
ncbi:hypothetical protein FJZ36_03030 [Candidatus Poribacteria bacterium]|nr:hypothetical protein [Candidatus Poribacteria bacterium]